MIYKLNPIMNKDLNILYKNDEPPKLYDLMNSYVNYDREIKLNINDSIKKFKTYLFDFYYPIDPLLKSQFEEMFLKHFIFRQIGFETFTTFKIHLDVKLNTIMPKYNKMFEGFNLLDFAGSSEKHIRQESNINHGVTTNDLESTIDNRFSNVPQNEIEDVKDGSYMTDYTLNSTKSNNTNEIDGTLNTNENIDIQKVDTIDEYEKFLKYANNIYDAIFKELDSLFFQVV